MGHRTPEGVTGRALPFLLKGLPEDVAARLDRGYAARVIALAQECFKTLADVPALTSYFFVEQPEYDAAVLLSKQLEAARGAATLDLLLPMLADVADWTHETLLATLDRFVTEHGFIRTKADGSTVPDRGPVFMLVRVAVSGRKETPGPPHMLDVLRQERPLRRLAFARAQLGQRTAE